MSKYVLILPLLNVCLVHTTVNINYKYPNNFVCPVFMFKTLYSNINVYNTSYGETFMQTIYGLLLCLMNLRGCQDVVTLD